MIKKIKIFGLDYLSFADFTDDDLYVLFNSNSLKYSLIKAEFAMAGIPISDDQLKKEVKKPRWQYKYFWDTMKHEQEFEQACIDVFKNVYQYSNEDAKAQMQYFIIQYGLSNPKIKNSKYTNYLDE